MKRSKTETVLPGYTSVPIPVLDATVGNTDIVTRITLHFPSTLSLTRLEDSWYSLVRTWPILAARVRTTPSTPSGLSFFVPTQEALESLEKRSRDPASKPLQKHIALVDASTRSIAEYHAIVGKAVHSQLSAEQISVGTPPDRKEQDAMTCSNASMSWKQLLKEDQAFVTAAATQWKDATTVTISFSHTLGDAFTVKSIFEAWAKRLKGESVEELEDLGKDPFVKYVPQEGMTEKLPVGWTKFGFVKKVKLISNLLWDIKVRRPEKEFAQYYMFMPQAKVDQLMKEARSDLERLAASDATSSNNSEEKPARDYTVSTFNVLFAWLLQNIHAANPKPRKTSSVVTIVNAKTRPPSGHVAEDYPAHPLWGGAFGAPLRPLSSGDYATLPLGQVALHIRESLKDQVAPDNIRDNVSMLLRHSQWKKPSGELIFFTEGTSDYMSGCTEWRSAKFAQVDFGSATTDAKEAKPVAIAAHMEIPVSQRNRWVLFGDAGGGVWFSGGMTRKEVRNKKGFGRYQWVG